ncbi:unnamed protein product [Effrenium voratum]|uniref:SAM-dependent MTase RsmB/NOP-type domain-containing protein n=1 Tax=Effrenium voratum TaxID=2562239 RepID=A0AA36N7F7_9DINO|nr:unnamed protein product [Effrenium voratum]
MGVLGDDSRADLEEPMELPRPQVRGARGLRLRLGNGHGRRTGRGTTPLWVSHSEVCPSVRNLYGCFLLKRRLGLIAAPVNGFEFRHKGVEHAFSFVPFIMVRNCKFQAITSNGVDLAQFRCFKVSMFTHGVCLYFGVHEKEHSPSAEEKRAAWVLDISRAVRLVTQSLFPSFQIAVRPLANAPHTRRRIMAGYLAHHDDTSTTSVLYCELQPQQGEQGRLVMYDNENCQDSLSEVILSPRTVCTEKIGISCTCFTVDQHLFSARTIAERKLWLRALSNIKVKLQNGAPEPDDEGLRQYRVAILEHARTTGCNDSQAVMDALLQRHVRKAEFPEMPFGYNQDGFFAAPMQPDTQRPRSKHLHRAKRKLAKNSSAPSADLPEDGEAVGNFGAIITEGLQRFEEHYRPLGLARDEEWAKLAHSLRQPLPLAFRLKSPDAVPELQRFREELREGCTTARSRFVPAPRFFGFSQAVSLGCDAKTLRQEQWEAPGSALGRLARWLAESQAKGLVSRQEVVSTVPVALLEVQPGHVVLDMCAAPGSKTLQAVQALEADGSTAPSGALVANELCAPRARVLARRCASSMVAVVQHKAQVFPGPAVYDRIICDVPCSGDGTMRKHPEKWRTWSPQLGRQLHARQLQIALRAAALLKPGGVMSYSTCSFNPLENEAVVAALLERTHGALELQAAPQLSGLPVRPGLSTWTVEDLAGVPKRERRRFRCSMWPPAASKFPLERCVRCLPFLANTGGFFVALLKKVKPWPGAPQAAASAPGASGLGEFLEMPPEVAVAQFLDGFTGAEVLRMQKAEGITEITEPGATTRQLVAQDLSESSKWRWLRRGHRKLFHCSDTLVSVLSTPRPRALALVSAGLCAFSRPRASATWRVTAAGGELLQLRREANAAAKRKVLEGHLCASCGQRRLGASFSRKMLTRPPAKRRCAECVGQKAAAKAAHGSPAKQPDMAGAGDAPVEAESEASSPAHEVYSDPTVVSWRGTVTAI